VQKCKGGKLVRTAGKARSKYFNLPVHDFCHYTQFDKLFDKMGFSYGNINIMFSVVTGNVDEEVSKEANRRQCNWNTWSV